ncbi:ABC transporter substrate-binding protein, partial [Microbacterium sp.]|uniref:ABC transporter substrate-binding protein n=1 Tax=Microbacterium sp. TaxID=51671 RepID=UPI0039E4CC30
MAARFEIDRRQFLQNTGLLAAIAMSGTSLALAFDARRDPRTPIRFYSAKREMKAYYQALTNQFNQQQADFVAAFEQSTNLAADFARNTPVAVGITDLQQATGAYLRLGATADQSDNPLVDQIDPHAIDIIRQYASFNDQLGALPFSIAGQGVIYNRDLFDEAGVTVPTTWSEMLEVCEKLKSKGITPLIGTFADIWTIEFSLFNHGVSGMLNVGEFFDKLNALGVDAGPDASTSFSKDFREPMLKVVGLLPYYQAGVKNIGYDQGNRDLGDGKGAMLIQGPWALNGVLGANKDFKAGMFPLPMTDDPDDTQVMMNLDQMVFTPATATGKQRDGGLEFMDFVLQPDMVDAYNLDQHAFSPLKNAKSTEDPMIEDLQPYMESGRYQMGPTIYIPAAIDKGRYLQEYIYAMMADPTNE